MCGPPCRAHGGAADLLDGLPGVRYHRREQGARRAARDAERRRLLESALGLPKRRTQEAYRLTRLGILAGLGNDLFRVILRENVDGVPKSAAVGFVRTTVRGGWM